MKKSTVVTLVALATASCAVAVIVARKRRNRTQIISMQSLKGRSGLAGAEIILKEFQKSCATPLSLLRDISDAMVKEMDAGLQSENGSCLQMLLSYVQKLPTGDEKGLFYALDLGGTNFRVLRVHLGGKENRIISQEFDEASIPVNLMVGSAKDLFDYIAAKLAKFVKTEDETFPLSPGRKRELGFTFSFPVKQTAIDSGMLVNWTKGFSVPEMVGNDVVEVLNGALERQGLDMRVAALINDTVGTLAGGRYWDEDVMAAIILGTGTNACYVERADGIPEEKGHCDKCGEMVINMEWGNFQSNHLPITDIDRDLDAKTINPGYQVFEKLISGMYLGDIARRILLRMAQEASLFEPDVLTKLSTPFLLRTPDMSAIHQDSSPDLVVVQRKLRDVLGIENTTLETRKLVVDVCNTVTERSARLAAAGVFGILKKIGRAGSEVSCTKRTVVSMDGGLYEHYPLFRKYMHDTVNELVGPQISKYIFIEHSMDGSGIGASLLAASHSIYPVGQDQ